VHFCPAEKKRSGERRLDRLVEVRVGHDDQRVVAAELELDVLAAPDGLLPDAPPHGHRAGERHRADGGVAHERRADVGTAADDDVQDAGGQPSLLQDRGEMEGRQRCILGGLEHDAVPVHERRGRFPDRNGRGEVPRGDETHDAEGAADRGHGRAVGLLKELARRAPALPGEEPQDGADAAGLEAGLAQRLAHLASHAPRDRLRALLGELGGAIEDRAAGGGRGSRPGPKARCAAWAAASRSSEVELG
jgi:hypothetical protein